MKSSSATGTTIAEAPFASPVAAGEVDRRSGESSGYVGRFAPSPSGPLHFGSLVAALGSWLDARAHRGRWLVRIEDIDPPREKPGAADAILRTLETLGLDWDGEVLRQSTRTAAYAAALARLGRQNLLHACQCTRAALTQLPQNRDRAPGSNDELFHPRRCPTAAPGAVAGQAWRLRVPDGRVAFTDRSLGEQDSDVAASVGNFVLRRRDGLFAYQLAVVVDDAYQGITDVVRGCDLLASTPRQVLLQQALGLPRVRYLHLPLAVDRRGRKLSKSEDAPAADRSTPAAQLVAALEFLGQHPPAALGNATPRDVLEWAREHWGVQGFAGRVSGAAPQGADAGNAGEERA